MAKYEARETWLHKGMTAMRGMFKKAGYEVPENVRVSCGWPHSGGTGKRRKAIGEAWCSRASKDKKFEIFISPVLDNEEKVLATLAHEMVHVTVGLDCGHKGMFGMAARAIGLEGKMTATVAGEALKKELKLIADGIGKYPHGSLEKMTNGKKKQSTRLIKAHCLTCTYTIRASMQWLLLGVPDCPNPDCINQGKPMEIDLPDEDGEKCLNDA